MDLHVVNVENGILGFVLRFTDLGQIKSIKISKVINSIFLK